MIKQYIKQALQQLRENTLVSVISIAGTALAIAMILVMVLVFQINSAGFAPETDRNRFLYVWGTEIAPKNEQGSRNRGNMSAEVVKECFYTLKRPEAVAAYVRDKRPVSLPGKRSFKEYDICYTDAGYWHIFDHRFVEGGAFGEADFRSAVPKIVLSRRMATRLFGGEKAVGRQVVMDYVTFTVCGVVSDVPNPLMVSYFDACVPYSCDDNLMRGNSEYGENMVGVLSMVLLARSSSDFDAVRSELDARVRRYNEGKADYSVDFPAGALSQLDAAMGSGAWKRVDWKTYLAGSGAFLFFLLLVPALNLTGVIQSSVQKRKEEIGLRKAFGATGRNLLTQILSENLVLTLIGGAIGIGLSLLLLVLSKSFMLNEGITLTLPMLIKPGLFLSALVFVFLLNILSAGIPAWRTTRQPIVEALKGEE
ncbi:MAG: ABC transporter permease [Parabacteroides sp.]|nr:ABC transporter permease [Parabacteroides sp.]